MTDQLALFEEVSIPIYNRCQQQLLRPTAATKKQQAPCELCGRYHGWYESHLETNVREDIRDLYRRTCAGCRSKYIGVIKAHQLNTTLALRLITAEFCELCEGRFSIASNGRRNVHVDHDHFCCPGSNSCGACVRGFVCPRCNHVIASIEGVRDIGLDRVAVYLARADASPPAPELAQPCEKEGVFS